MALGGFKFDKKILLEIPKLSDPPRLRASFCALRRKSCELCHVIYLKLTILIIVSSFPKLNDGQQNFFSCLLTTEAWTFCKMNALNPLRFTSHQKNWEKCLFFNLANFWMIKLTKTSILPNCQVSNSFLVYCKCYHS